MVRPKGDAGCLTAICAAAAMLFAAAACGPTRGYVPPGFTPVEAAWERHHDEERAGRLDAAAEGYRALCAEDPDFPRACYDRARVLFDLGRIAEARAEATVFAVEHPEHALGPVIVKRLAVSYADAGEATAGVAALEALASRVGGTDVWDSVEFEIARLHRARGDGASEARTLAKVVALGRWGGQLWPDAIWRLIELAADRGDRAEEERLLEELIASREESRLIASYDTKFQAEAYLRLGRLLLDEGKLDRAYGTFVELGEWETSRLRDDGYYWAAVVRMRQGRAADACKLLRIVSSEMSWSSSVDDAEGLMREARCGGAGEGAASGQ
jgi:tetratricopeptide (TPR) repeat protein